MDDPNTTCIAIPRHVIDISHVPNEAPTDVVPALPLLQIATMIMIHLISVMTVNPTAINNNLNIISQTSTTTILQDKFVHLYHEDKSYMVLQDYCLPVTTVNPNLRKYELRSSINVPGFAWVLPLILT
jgi:hypothetical protein